MLKIAYTNQFLKDLELAKKRNLPKPELDAVVRLLSEEKQLPQQYNDHPLKGKYDGFRECHIRPDRLLIYRIQKQVLQLVLTRTGTHSDLF
jgi:mRNA interferase YafQ